VDFGEIAIILIAFIGPLLVYLTRKVVKGRTPTAMRLWFVSVCSYVVYYLLANGAFLDAKIAPYYFALLWPIPAILTFWVVERTAAAKQSPVIFKWTAYFLVGVVFAFLLDVVANTLGWYTYNTSAVTSSLITNPLTSTEVPAIILLMLGVTMMGVFYLSETFFRWLRQKVRSNSSATYLLIGLAFILGGLVWTIGDLLMKPIK
jgi:hypothetical protein